jgi:hypothetical protein
MGECSTVVLDGEVMSPSVRYGFALIVAGYGIYQIYNDHAIAGFIGLALAALLIWLGRLRR